MTPRSSLPLWAALLGSAVAGVLTAIQSRVNGGLSLALGNGYLTAAVSFGSGLLILSLVMLASRSGRAGLGLVREELRRRHLPWWALAGGACGAFFVLGQGTTAPLLGLALFTVGVVAGQVLGGLLIDRLGIGPSGRIVPTTPRLVGTVLAIVAVILSVVVDLGSTGLTVLFVIVPFIAGALVSWQSAVNGLLRSAAHSAITATFLSFVVGTSVLVVVAGVSVAVQGWPETWPSNPLFYSGGFLGVIFIALLATLVRRAGVLLLSMSNVAGQLVAALALEASVPLAAGVTPWMLAGTVLALIAVGIAAVSGRSR